MDFITLILLSFGLAADAFAVSLSDGMCSKHVTKNNAIAVAASFGFYQAIMPVLGFLLGCTFAEIIGKFQHWVALFLLSAIGINMIWDSIKEANNPDCPPSKDIFSAKNLTLQGIATSIDALAVGVGLAVIQANIVSSALVIGIITFASCLVGVLIGHRFGSFLGCKAKMAGAILLILIGIRIFLMNV